MNELKLWNLTIRDKVTGNFGTYKIWAMTGQEAYEKACIEDEHDAIPTGNYELYHVIPFEDDDDYDENDDADLGDIVYFGFEE